MQEISAFLVRHYPLSLGVVVLFIIIIIIEWLRAKNRPLGLSPLQLTQLINKENATILDIRPSNSFRQGHIIHATSAVSQDLLSQTQKLNKYKTRPIIIVCDNGVQSQQIAGKLLKQGYQSYALAGGMKNWASANMPIIKE